MLLKRSPTTQYRYLPGSASTAAAIATFLDSSSHYKGSCIIVVPTKLGAHARWV